ncbi:type II secretion system F family protein [Candidatus Dependentiae bacterium]|nr:type II secretion system F family protein [Candidatus Dependentiae bacterium]
MPIYYYRVYDKFGKLAKGKKEEDSLEKIRTYLINCNYYIVSIKEEKRNFKFLKFKSKTIKSDEMFFFFRQLSVLVKAGIPLISALDSIAKLMKSNEYFQSVLTNIIEKIKSGDSFSNSLRVYEQYFKPANINMIEAAEVSGQLELVLDRISVLLQKTEQTKSNIKTAVTYPAVVISVAGLVISFILVFILPKFVSIYQTRSIELPVITKMLIIVSKIMSNYWYYLILGLLLIFFCFKYFIKKNENFQIQWHGFLFKIPFFGDLYFISQLTNICSILGFMYKSGVPLLKSLRVLETIIDNKILRNVVKQSADSIEIGDTLTNSLTSADIFPDTFLKMVAAGESSGKLDDLMLFISSYYDDEIEIKVKRMSSMLEPILILIIGIIVGFIAVATLLPIFTLMRSFK